MKLFLVGGTVRDTLMGLPPSKDVDFAVEDVDYSVMKYNLTQQYNLNIWQERPEFVTLRGNISKSKLSTVMRNYLKHMPDIVNADFTLCREEAMYSDKRHPDRVTPATIIEDLSRRDFTCNAVALNEQGSYVDPYDGATDAKKRLLRCVGRPEERFTEDPLRMLRALRFAVTKNMHIDGPIGVALHDPGIVALLGTLPVERIREELFKMFDHNSIHSMIQLRRYDRLMSHVFSRNIKLVPTITKEG